MIEILVAFYNRYYRCMVYSIISLYIMTQACVNVDAISFNVAMSAGVKIQQR